MKTIVFFREVFDWMGRHSGYDQVCDAIARSGLYRCHSVYRPEDSKTIDSYLHRNLDPWLLKKVKPNPFYNLRNVYAERRAILTSLVKSADVLHINYVENNYALASMPLLLPWTRIVGTVHQPPEWYEENYNRKKNLKKLDAIIILSSKVKDYFERIHPGRVYKIPHGIDTDFFKPLSEDLRPDRQRRIIFSGHWLRDIKTLYLTAAEIIGRFPDVQFDLLVPLNKRYDGYFNEIGKLNNINWHAGLSDEELLVLYNKADLMFLPMIDCTANNAVLEAMACGKPIISNNVGGLPEYTHSSFATLLQPGDVSGAVEHIAGLLHNPDLMREKGRFARDYALQNFSWDQVAASTMGVYRKK